MGHRAHGAVFERARLRFTAALACAAWIVSVAGHSAAYAALPALTVYAIQPTVRTSLHLQTGFALVVRADRRIDTVAIGDPRMISAAPVHRGSDVFDIVLQPLADTGTTNMVLWLGDVTTVWTLDIGPAQRTTDVVYVVTQRHPAQAPQATAPASHAATPPPAAAPGTPTPAPASPGGSTAPPASGTAPTVEVRQTSGPVNARVEAVRTKNGIVLRYDITNSGDTDVAIKPSSVLVRADGRSAAYGMARQSVDGAKPDIIPQGATERGLIDVAVPLARQIQLTLSLIPVQSLPAPPVGDGATPPRSDGPPSPALPFVLQMTFNGLDRLPVTAP